MIDTNFISRVLVYPELFPKLPLIIFTHDSSLEETVIFSSHFERLISLAVRGHIMWLKKIVTYV